LATVLALLALPYCHHAAVRLLSPQTGEWLAASFCSLSLFAVAALAATTGHAAEQTAAVWHLLHAPSNSGGSSVGGAFVTFSWAGAAASAAALAGRWHGTSLVQLVGSWVLAPGLADDSSRRLSYAELTLRCMALAVLTCGPLFACLGCALGAGTARGLVQPDGAAAHRKAALPALAVALAGAASSARGLPLALVPPRPAATLPAALALLGALVALALLSLQHSEGFPAWQQQQQPQPAEAGSAMLSKLAKGGSASSKRPRASGGNKALGWSVGAAALAALAAAAAAQLAMGSACGPTQQQIGGGRYSLLWRCEAAAGGQLAVVEGLYKDKYWQALLAICRAVVWVVVWVPFLPHDYFHLPHVPMSQPSAAIRY
jgi:hypothetical protein